MNMSLLEDQMIHGGWPRRPNPPRIEMTHPSTPGGSVGCVGRSEPVVGRGTAACVAGSADRARRSGLRQQRALPAAASQSGQRGSRLALGFHAPLAGRLDLETPSRALQPFAGQLQRGHPLPQKHASPASRPLSRQAGVCK